MNVNRLIYHLMCATHQLGTPTLKVAIIHPDFFQANTLINSCNCLLLKSSFTFCQKSHGWISAHCVVFVNVRLKPLNVAVIYPATSAECDWPINQPTAVKEIYFIKEKEIYEITIFLHFYVYLMASQTICGVFGGNLPNRAAMPELSNWSRAWQKDINKSPKI